MGDGTHDISIVIPAYRESLRINPLILHLQRLEGIERCEIIIVDGEKPPSTLNSLRYPGVRTLTSPKGRARQMNAGAGAARGETLLFLHADTFLPARAIERIVEVMKDDSVAAGAFGLRFDSARHWHAWVARMATFRSRITRVPLGDHGIFVRRKYFDDLGGYADIPILEDVELMGRIKRRGGRIRILRDYVCTSARRLEREGVLYCTVRGAMFLLLFWLGYSPHRLKGYYPDEDRV